MWSRLADDIEAITALVGPGAAGWPLLGVTWEQVDQGIDGQVLEIRAETSDGDTDLVGLWPLEDGKPTGPYHVVLRVLPGQRAQTAPYPGGFVPPHPAQGAASERSRWLGIRPE